MFEFAAIFITSFTVALSGALMPGPLFTITISESARRGCRAGPLLIAGHALLELVLVIAVCRGLGVYLKMDPVMAATAFLGGFILLWFGIDMVRTAGKLSLARDIEGPSGAGGGNLVLTGAVASLANPYWTLWWTTFGLGYLMKISDTGAAGVAVFFTGHIAADFVWYSFISFGVGRGRSLMRDGAYRGLIRACGVFLVFFGGWFLVSARDYLMKSIS
ncbi:MAG: LysE family transporter [Syntrophobacteraceae bacterium]